MQVVHDDRVSLGDGGVQVVEAQAAQADRVLQVGRLGQQQLAEGL